MSRQRVAHGKAVAPLASDIAEAPTPAIELF
jgi:hypothetical protein